MKITEQQFEEQFKPQINHILGTHNGEPNAPFCGWGYETFGNELEYVHQINNVSPKRVWTVMDSDEEIEGDDGEPTVNMVIVAGYHHVNRQLYVITENEWVDDMTTVVFD